MKFYLGAHLPNWLPLASMPLMVSRRRCANCLRWAERWHTRLVTTIGRHAGAQLALPFGEAEAASSPIGAVLPKCQRCGARALDFHDLDQEEIDQVLMLLELELCPVCTTPIVSEMADHWRATALAA